jgi:hypothetical protein
MHATIPALPHGIHFLMHSKFDHARIAQLPEQIGGRLLAKAIAEAIELVFGFLAFDKLDISHARKAESFFDENFVMRDPNAPDNTRYYQGKILIRTRKPGDDMNIYIRFCPNPDALYLPTPLGKLINPIAIVHAEAVSEDEAEAIEGDPERMDLVIRFRDISAILGLVQRPDVDVVQLLLENLVQITGNFGHLFKFGAIGKNVQSAIMGRG